MPCGLPHSKCLCGCGMVNKSGYKNRVAQRNNVVKVGAKKPVGGSRGAYIQTKQNEKKAHSTMFKQPRRYQHHTYKVPKVSATDYFGGL